LKDEFTFIRNRINRYYDYTKSLTLIFKEGDKIYFLYYNIKIKRPNNKFDFKKIKLFKIIKKI
ncbi:hypothetical protein B0T20DRAFT_338165, partial [Sordaria brevicollis]